MLTSDLWRRVRDKAAGVFWMSACHSALFSAAYERIDRALCDYRARAYRSASVILCRHQIKPAATKFENARYRYVLSMTSIFELGRSWIRTKPWVKMNENGASCASDCSSSNLDEFTRLTARTTNFLLTRSNGKAVLPIAWFWWDGQWRMNNEIKRVYIHYSKVLRYEVLVYYV